MNRGSPSDLSSSSELCCSPYTSASDRHQSSTRRRRGHLRCAMLSQRDHHDGLRKRENGKIDKLTEDLYDASRAIHCNEQMLREIKHNSRDHRKEMAKLKYDLEQSQRRLSEERERRREAVGDGHAHCRSVHFTECPETWKAGHLAAQLEAEKMERSRVESERAQVLSMLNSSLKAKEQVQHQTASDSDLLKEIRSLREEVLSSRTLRDAVPVHNDSLNRSRRAEVSCHPDLPSKTQVAQLRRDIAQLNETLLDERELLDCNRSEMGHLSEKVGKLLQPVGQRGHNPREEPGQGQSREWSHRQEVVSLQQDLMKAEVEREQLSRQCKLLQDVNDKQTSLCEENRLQIRGLDASVLALEKERDRTEQKCQQLEGLLHRAEVELREMAAEKDRNVTSLERAAVDRARLQSAAAALEERLREVEKDTEKGLAANKQLTADLQHSSNERTRMLAEVDDLRQRVELQERRLKEVEGEKVALDTQLSSATGQLRHAREKATESIRRLKLQCRHSEEKLVRLSRERDELVSLHESAAAELDEHRQLLRTSGGVQEHNVALQERIASLDCQLTQQTVEKAQFESKIDILKGTNKRLQRSLEKMQCDAVSLEGQVQELQEENKRLALKGKENHLRSMAERDGEVKELHQRLERKTEALTQLKNELVSLQSENSSLNGKLTKLGQICQRLKRELSSCAIDKTKGDTEADRYRQQLSVLQETLQQKEQRYEEEIGATLEQHQREVMELREAHSRELEELRSSLAELQVKLTDEQSTVHVLRRQQVKVLDDQQRWGDNLSQSLEDTEKLRRKYAKARKYYEDKLAALELERADSAREENSQLRWDLQEAQQALAQRSNDYELAMKTAHAEVTSLVERVGAKVGIPEFPECAGYDGDLKRWCADVTGKLKWLQSEVENALVPDSKPLVVFK